MVKFNRLTLRSSCTVQLRCQGRHPTMDDYLVVIIVTIVGFCALAAALLVPVYLFLKKEEKLADSWTRERLSQGNGHALFEESEEAIGDSLQIDQRLKDRS